jgi:exopolysaccharide biosynthesis protein
MKSFFRFIRRVFIILITFIVFLLATVYFCCFVITHGPSETARDLFVTTILETGQMKFLASWFLSNEKIQEIVNKNSLTVMEEDTDSSLVEVSKDVSDEVIVEEVSGDNFTGTMLIIKDPSKVFVGTIYPWGEYGKTLDEIVKKYDALAGVNGGLYVSTANKGGRPIGIVVSEGEIQNTNGIGYAGLHLIGMSKDNILKIIDISGKNLEQIKELLNKEQIRDAICFQEESSDKNNHFVKLIINGESRQLSGLGSGANPRTVIGQRKDGTMLIFVTDGRGANGHLGATASDLIEVMQKYGAFNAANIDGGSSSAMYYKDGYLRTSVTLYYSNSSWRIPTSILVRK